MDLPLELLERSLIERELKRKDLLNKFYMEVGCGDGFNLDRFSILGMNGIAMDQSLDAIKILRMKNLPGVEVIQADFMETPVLQNKLYSAYLYVKCS